mgnify:CR=1 FL=1
MDRDATAKTVRVWDPFVRIAHWSLVILFAVSYLSEGEPEWLHTWSGYIIAGLVVLRILWGFVGSQHARFSDFVTGPFNALRYLVDMLRGTSPRYLGHSPAGGAMTIALILALLVTTGTGNCAIGTGGLEEHPAASPAHHSKPKPKKLNGFRSLRR